MIYIRIPLPYLRDSEYGTFDYHVQYKHATGDRLCCACSAVCHG